MLNNYLRKSVLFLLFWSFCPLWVFCAFMKPDGPAAQEVIPTLVIPDELTGYSDLDCYYSQLQKNNRREIEVRRRFLLETTSITQFFNNYIERGIDVVRDTASVFELIDDYYYTTEQRQMILSQFYETALQRKSESLKRMADLLQGRLIDSSDEKINWFEELISRCHKAGDRDLEALVLNELRFHCFENENQANGFHYVQRLVDLLEKTGNDYPLKGQFYSWIGTNYYRFKDYDRALYFLHKGLSYRGHYDIRSYVRTCLTAWNHLATYYQTLGEVDSTVYYNRTILLSTEGTADYPIHISIALCNLARIEMANGNYDAAIAMLQAGLINIEDEPTAWDFHIGIYLSLGECMLVKENLPAVVGYMDKIRDALPDFPESTQMYRFKDLFALESKYYSRLGQYDKAAVSLDSAQFCAQRYEQLTGQHFIVIGEQQQKEAELLLKNEQIAKQKNIIFFTLLIMGLICSGLFLIARLYRKKNAAYKELVRKANAWAYEDKTALTPDLQKEEDNNDPVTDEEIGIMERIDAEMISHHLYRETGLTAESLAERMGIHRNQLSRVINKVTGGNFNNYINSLRIKEAVRLISASTHKELYINELYERIGFTNRSTFYRIFKQFTGLSPIEFQKKKDKTLSADFLTKR